MAEVYGPAPVAPKTGLAVLPGSVRGWPWRVSVTVAVTVAVAVAVTVSVTASVAVAVVVAVTVEAGAPEDDSLAGVDESLLLPAITAPAVPPTTSPTSEPDQRCDPAGLATGRPSGRQDAARGGGLLGPRAAGAGSVGGSTAVSSAAGWVGYRCSVQSEPSQ